MSTFRVPVLESFAWQEPILGIVNSPVVTTKGSRYIVGSSPSGAFATFAPNSIAWMDDVWKTDTPATGWTVYNSADVAKYVFDGSQWTSASVMDGLTLTGDIDSDADDIDWNLHDNVLEALTFVTATDVKMLNFNTTNSAEAVEINSILKISNDINLSAGAVDVELAQAANAISFNSDTTSVLTIDSINDTLIAGRDVVIKGNLLVQGATTTIETTQMVIEDPTITLNKGGSAVTANGAGIEFESNGSITGFIKTSTDGFVLESTENNFLLTLDINATSTLLMGGNLNVESASIINQDLTTDSTSVEFAGLKLTGNIDLATADRIVSLYDNSATALSFNTVGKNGLLTLNTTDGFEGISTSGTLTVAGSTILNGDINLTSGARDVDLINNNSEALSFDSTGLSGILSISTTTGSEKVSFGKDIAVLGAASFATTAIFADVDATGADTIVDAGGAGTNVAQMERSYDSRAQYDTALRVMRFVNPDIYVD